MKATQDMINRLPAPVLESILCLLPIQEAARTSILSKDWRYHWTKISKLVFIEDEVKISSKDDYDERLRESHRKLFYAMNQVMSMHQGPIQEFSVHMYVSGRCLEIDNIIDHLARNNSVKTLALDMFGYWLPETLFSLHKLTDLYLRRCHLFVQPTLFNGGFYSLANLYMEDVTTTMKMLIHFLSRCPLLKIVNLDASFDPMLAATTGDSALVELLECLPLIEHLTISDSMLKYLCQGRVPIQNKLPAALVHLKYLCIKDTRVFYQHKIACLAFLIRSSPNLEKLNLKIWSDLVLETTREDYSDIRLEHLNEIQIENCFNSNACTLEFLRLMMAKSPVLKRVRILLRKNASRDQELKIARRFLRSRCASPVVQVIVESGLKYDYKPFYRM